MPRRSGSRRRPNLVERHCSAALERLQHRVMLSSTGIFPIADPVESLGEELRQVAHERLASQAGSLQSAGVVVEQIDHTIEITGSDQADSVQVSLDATGNLRVSIQHDNVSDDFFFAADGVAELMFRGNAGDDHFINMTSVPLSAFGGPGNDTILGGFGRDRLRGGNGDDLLKGDPDARSSAAVTPAQENDDTLLGGAGDDRLWGRNGDDRLYGGSGNDRLVGGRGSDTISGKTGDDFIDGRSGDDALFGGASNDIIIGGSGSDRLRGGIGRDLLIGGLDSDHLTGQSGQDIVIGGSTSFDNSLAALRRISSAFVAESHYFVRVTQLSDPESIESLVLDQSVHDDQAGDVLLGGTGRDWFFRPRNPCFEEEQAEQFPDLLRDEALNDFIPAAGRAPESLHSNSATHGTMALVPVDEATDVATRNGPWLDPTTWEGNAVPVIGARVWIPTGLTVSIDGLVGQAAASVRVDGVLRFDPFVNTELRAGTVVVSTLGRFEMGTAAQPIQSDVSATLTIADLGEIDRERDPQALGRGLIVAGQAEIFGTEKTPYAVLQSSPQRNDVELELNDTPVNWRPGDKLVLPGVNPKRNQDEQFEIIGIDGNRVMVPPLRFSHLTPREDLQIHLANLKRNAVIRSENPALLHRGHVMFMHTKDVQIHNAAFEDLGRMNKLVTVNDPVIDQDGQLVPGSGTNPRGRYALHFHRPGVENDGSPAVVRGSVVHNSPGWGFVNHSGFVDFEDNVAFNVDGAAFVTEAGNEIGSFRRNLAIRSVGSGEDKTYSRQNEQDFGHQGDGFWFQGLGVTVEDNIAVGHAGHGFISWTRGLVEPDLQIRGDDHDRATLFTAANLDDPSLAAGAAMIEVTDVPIHAFRRNVAYGSAHGISIQYNGFRGTDRLGHDDFDRPKIAGVNVVEDLVAWSNEIGVQVYYGDQVIVRNATIIGRVANPSGTGLSANIGTQNLTIEDASIEGYRFGVRAPRRGRTVIDGGFFRNVEDIRISSNDFPADRAALKSSGLREVIVTGEIEFAPLTESALRGRTRIHINPRTNLTSERCQFDHIFESDTIMLDFGSFENSRLHFDIQNPDAVPFPEAINHLPPEWVGLTTSQLLGLSGQPLAGSIAAPGSLIGPILVQD